MLRRYTHYDGGDGKIFSGKPVIICAQMHMDWRIFKKETEARRMTFSELRKKDVICIGDGRVLGRVTDLELDASSGQICALIVPGGSGVSCFFHGEKSQSSIAWQQIACIGDDVILISPTKCR